MMAIRAVHVGNVLLDFNSADRCFTSSSLWIRFAWWMDAERPAAAAGLEKRPPSCSFCRLLGIMYSIVRRWRTRVCWSTDAPPFLIQPGAICN